MLPALFHAPERRRLHHASPTFFPGDSPPATLLSHSPRSLSGHYSPGTISGRSRGASRRIPETTADRAFLPQSSAATVSFLRRNAKNQNDKSMDIVEFPNDRTVISTENNGFAGGERDENLIDEELLETEIPLDDRIPDAAHEDAENDRPVYDEEGYRHDPGGE